MEPVTVREVRTRKEKKDFIYLPSDVHSGDSSWLPPIYLDEWELYNKKKNKSYNYSDAVLLIAYRGRKPVGRIMGIVNRRYNEIHNEENGRFCFMECFNDVEVFHLLMTEAEAWARKRGMKKMIGPLGFSDKDPQGFQIEGFDLPQFITCPNNYPYMPELLEKEGYVKHLDLVNYIASMPESLPELYVKILNRVEQSNGFRVKEFRNKKELKPYIVPVLEVMNKTFMEIYGFVPLNEKEKRELAARYLPILDPKFIKVIETDSGLAAFAIGMPDVSEGVRKAGGKLLPFGIFKILSEARKSKKLLMMLGGVLKEYRGQGLDVLMGAKILESGIRYGMDHIDSHLVLETNSRMRAEYERIGGKVVKRFRIYSKDL
jgi:ribosomal protein S18 acetylase RimI-like enzyme